jgi:DNA helicase-2/ATP-dependent DNA helicase PcrA
MSRRIVKRPSATPARVYTQEDLIEGLNDEQAEVVRHTHGPLLCAAIAGSGKTTALVRRMANLVMSNVTDPARILALTFSKKAAEEMNTRLLQLLPNDVGREARVGTFHSLAFQFLREEKTDLRRWQVDERDRYRTVVKDVIGFRGMRWDSADLTVVEGFIGRCKASCALPGTQAALDLAKAFHKAKPIGQRMPALLVEAYERAEVERHSRLMLTYDDMLLEMWCLLDANEAVRVRWASRWDFVLQDESQDENLVQRGIATHLAKDHTNYMVVGDPAQSIYGFRGADPSGILAFAGQWSARRIELHRNYRSGSKIVEVANNLLGAMAPHTTLGTRITACRGTEGAVGFVGYANADDEAEGVVDSMRELQADGRAWRDFSVLYRTNSQSRALEEQLLSARVPYVVIGGTNFYERKEVKDLLSYLRIAAGRGQFEDVRRSINAPFRFLGREFVAKIEQAADAFDTRDAKCAWTEIVRDLANSARVQIQDRQRHSARGWCDLIDSMAGAISQSRLSYEADSVAWAVNEADPARPAALLESLLMATDYVKWITRDEGAESPENNRLSNIRELVRASERFNSVDGLLDYIDETLEAAERAKSGEAGANRVVLMSIHRSKALEWPVVYVIGANEKLLPHGRAEDIEEERRLAYVAFTRARDVLNVSHINEASFGANVIELDVSRFVAESGIESIANAG